MLRGRPGQVCRTGPLIDLCFNASTSALEFGAEQCHLRRDSPARKAEAVMPTARVRRMATGTSSCTNGLMLSGSVMTAIEVVDGKRCN